MRTIVMGLLLATLAVTAHGAEKIKTLGPKAYLQSTAHRDGEDVSLPDDEE